MTRKFNNDDIVRMNSVLRHRFGNQISGIKNAVSLMAEELEGKVSPSIAEYFPLIDKECGSMDETLKRMTLLFDPVPQGLAMNILDLLANSTRALHSRYPKIQIKSSFSDGLSGVQVGDSNALSVAVREVAWNAAESGGSEVHFECGVHGDKLHLQIADNGKGIVADKIGLVFDPFYTAKSRHIGIGLSIALKMVEDLGGSINVSNGNGGGVVVLMILPAVS